MCGIFGWLQQSHVDPQVLCQELRHRGPDDHGIWSNPELTLGQVRLSILDLSDAGHQPMGYNRQNGACSQKHHSDLFQQAEVIIVYNGELYNYRELRDELKQLGFHFNTQCDTEVIAAAYLAWGDHCMERFNGMWSFALYSCHEKLLLLSRDRAGQKPLFYYQHNNQFCFGSEIKTIIKHIPQEARTIDPRSLSHYMLFSVTPSDQAMLKGIKKLKPSHSMVIDTMSGQVINVFRYWQREFDMSIDSLPDAAIQLRQKLETSVKRRLIADVPVGAFLSGGVDSSVLVAIMRKHCQHLNTFSVGFDVPGYNEAPYAQSVSKRLNTLHHDVSFNATQVGELCGSLSTYYDDPFGDASMIPMCLVSKVAKEHVSVCLSGTGGDELFAGYHRHHEFMRLKQLQSLPRFIQSYLTKVLGLINSDRASKLHQLLSSQDHAELYLKLFSFMFRSSEEEDYQLQQHQALFQLLQQSGLSPLNQLLNFEQEFYLAEDLLVKEDRATMAYSLEGRAPFLDVELMEFANQLHDRIKLSRKQGKIVLKQAFGDLLPHDILYRKKQGFGVPLANYFRDTLKDFAYQQLFQTKTEDYIEKSYLNKLWTSHQRGELDYSPLFWNLIMLNAWSEQWL